MPELPEVETIVRRLCPALVGQRIARAQVLWPRTIAMPSPRRFQERVRGQTIAALDRRGKYLLFKLSEGDTLITHLRMTGDFVFKPKGTPLDPYVRVRFALSNGQALWYTDVRKFGRMALTDKPDEVLGHLGPEPLSRRFTPRVLAAILRDRSRRRDCRAA